MCVFTCIGDRVSVHVCIYVRLYEHARMYVRVHERVYPGRHVPYNCTKSGPAVAIRKAGHAPSSITVQRSRCSHLIYTRVCNVHIGYYDAFKRLYIYMCVCVYTI